MIFSIVSLDAIIQYRLLVYWMLGPREVHPLVNAIAAPNLRELGLDEDVVEMHALQLLQVLHVVPLPNMSFHGI
jgi:hypothetical protein